MRVVFDVMRDGLAAINTAAQRMADARHDVATGRRLHAASLDPIGARDAVAEHATLGTLDAYTRTGDTAQARLAAADSTLNGYIDKLSAAIVSGTAARGSTTTPESRSALAADVRSLRDGLLSDINSSFNGTYLFSGAVTNTAAYANIGGAWTYQGDASSVQLEVQNGRLVTVAFDGQALAQGADAENVFTSLDALATAIEANDGVAIGTAVDALDRAFDRALRAQGALGADELAVYDASTRLADLRLAAETRRSKIEDTDLAEAITRMTQSETAYQATLAAVSRNERLSLLDFLR